MLVISTNHRAVRLWHSLGFEIIGRLPRAFQHPTDDESGTEVVFSPPQIEAVPLEHGSVCTGAIRHEKS
jgi:hypothetical protein